MRTHEREQKEVSSWHCRNGKVHFEFCSDDSDCCSHSVQSLFYKYSQMDRGSIDTCNLLPDRFTMDWEKETYFNDHDDPDQSSCIGRSVPGRFLQSLLEQS